MEFVYFKKIKFLINLLHFNNFEGEIDFEILVDIYFISIF